MWLVGMVFPFQDEPEHDSGEGRRVGINLALNGREPKRIAEGIDKCAHQARSLNSNELGSGKAAPVFNNQFAGEVCDAPEQEQDGSGTEQGAHCVYHTCHL